MSELDYESIIKETKSLMLFAAFIGGIVGSAVFAIALLIAHLIF